mmetsp:Transcript_13477/g.54465  ORF Transcript_13477/g.54465 Transcript_13477/m.54465 type:complete len:334 (-) Transcript_13477:96-1097(-)
MPLPGLQSHVHPVAVDCDDLGAGAVGIQARYLRSVLLVDVVQELQRVLHRAVAHLIRGAAQVLDGVHPLDGSVPSHVVDIPDIRQRVKRKLARAVAAVLLGVLGFEQPPGEVLLLLGNLTNRAEQREPRRREPAPARHLHHQRAPRVDLDVPGVHRHWGQREDRGSLGVRGEVDQGGHGPTRPPVVHGRHRGAQIAEERLFHQVATGHRRRRKLVMPSRVCHAAAEGGAQQRGGEEDVGVRGLVLLGLHRQGLDGLDGGIWSELDDVAFELLENVVDVLSGSVGSGRDRAALALETPSLPRGRNPESPCDCRWRGVGPVRPQTPEGNPGRERG